MGSFLPLMEPESPTPPDVLDAVLSELVDADDELHGLVLDALAARSTTHALMNERRLAAALAAGEFGIADLDPATGRARWSQTMAELHAVEGRGDGSDGTVRSPGHDAEGTMAELFAAVVDADRVALENAVVGVVREREPRTIDYRVGPDQRWVGSRITTQGDRAAEAPLFVVSSDVSRRRRLEMSRERRAASLEALQLVSRSIIGGRELDDTARAVVEAATGVLGGEQGVLLYVAPGDAAEGTGWVTSGIGADVAAPEWSARELLAAAGYDGFGVRTAGAASHDAAVAALLGSLGFTENGPMAGLVAPVTNGADVVALLAVAGHDDFTVDDVRLASSIASITNVAIEHARHHEQQRLASEAFQERLLRTESDVDDDAGPFELCRRYHPGRAGMEVGGDWYDVIRLDGDRLGLAVGDVCGHGLTAAADMGLLRQSFRVLVRAGTDPVAAMAATNLVALHDLETTATLAYVELEPDGEITAWICGHLPPIIAGPAGSVRWLDRDRGNGPMLGFVDDVHPEPIRDRLGPDETVLLYTDGLVERRGESIDLGLERLAARVGADGPLDDLCGLLYDELPDRGPEADDTALLAARRRS